jgi:hypothetical protein
MGKRDSSIDNLVVYLSLLLDGIQAKGLADGTDLTDAVTLQQLNAVAVGQGWDEAVWDEEAGDLKFYIDSVLNFTVNLDGRYPTSEEVADLIAAGATTIFTLNMPSGATVQQRIDGMTEGVDYPTGWVLNESGLDLVVTHSLGRQIANVTIFSNNTGDIWQQLPGTSAFSSLYSGSSDNTAQITSIATVNLPINVNLFFAV